METMAVQVLPGLPRDVMNIIVSKMDIETRMQLGIITRFKETRQFFELKRRLSETLSKVRIRESRIRDEYYVSIALGPRRSLLQNEDMDPDGLYVEPVYGIYREIIDDTLYNSYIIHAPTKESDMYASEACLGHPAVAYVAYGGYLGVYDMQAHTLSVYD